MAPIHPAAGSYLEFSRVFVGPWVDFPFRHFAVFLCRLQRYWLILSRPPDPRFTLIGERVRSLFIFGFIQKETTPLSCGGTDPPPDFLGFSLC